MKQVFMTFVLLSLSGSVLILLLEAFYPLNKRYFSKRWLYYIWLVVFVRLILPFSPKINFVNVLNDKLTKIQTETQSESVPEEELSQTDASTIVNAPSDLLIGADLVSKEVPKQTVPAIAEVKRVSFAVKDLWAVWLVTAVLLWMRKVILYSRFMARMKEDWTKVTDQELLNKLESLKKSIGIRKKIELYSNPYLSSPMLIGVLRPRILLPVTQLPESDYHYTILHELIHYKRGDAFYKWFVQLILCVHWFNPLVYLAESRMNRLCELSCDEAVIRELDLKGQREYGDTLLNAVRIGGASREMQVALALYKDKKILKERLQAIMEFKPLSSFRRCLSILCIIVLCLVATTTGVYASSEQKEATDSQQQASEIQVHTSKDQLTDLQKSEDTAEQKVGQTIKNEVEKTAENKTAVNQTEPNKVGANKIEADKAVAKNTAETKVNNAKTQEPKKITDKRLDREFEIAPLPKDAEDYTLIGRGYYQAPYLMHVYWTSFDIADGGLVGLLEYDASNRIDISISKKKSVAVYWGDDSLIYMKDQNALEALKKLLIKLNDVYEAASKPFDCIMLSHVTDISETGLDEIEKEFYEDESNYFPLLFPLLDEKDQKKYLKDMIENDKDHNYEDCIAQCSSKMADYCAGLAYKKDNYYMFTETVRYLTKKAKASWLKKCKKDGDSIYADAIGESN